jgi:D-glycerate 3-kinase
VTGALGADLAGRLLPPILAAAAAAHGPLVVGLTGPQGSGKSTVAEALRTRLRSRGLRTAVLGLDDLYLPRAERPKLPLLDVRGVPGTHDVALGLAVLEGLKRTGVVRAPRFDKAADDRMARWRRLVGPKDVILFEGWCVGAAPQAAAALAAPVNDLERERDPDGVGRRYINDRLDGDYQALFAQVSLQVLLLAPDFATVIGWRQQQEAALRTRTGRGMSDAAVATFVRHYERLTRHIAVEMPARADVVVRLGPTREILDVAG